MNVQLIVPVAVIILLGVIIAIIFHNSKDEEQFEQKLKKGYRKPKKPGIEHKESI